MKLISVRTLTIFFVLLVFMVDHAFSQTVNYSISGEKTATQQCSLTPQRKIVQQNDQSVTLEYEFTSFSVSEIQGDDLQQYQLIRMNSFGLANELGFPALPLRTEKIAIPENTYPVVRVESSDYIELKNYNIYPAQELGTDGPGFKTSFLKDKSAYRTNKYFPEKLSDIVDVQTYRGVDLAFLQIRPVRYNPVSGKVRIYKNLRIRVEFLPTSSKATKITKAQNQNLQVIKNSVINSLYISDLSGSHKTGTVVQPIGYIIVTVPQFMAAAERLAQWKRQLGYHVKILNQSSWAVAKIKSGVSNLYSSADISYEYLLLIGDQDHVPDYYYENTYLHPILPIYSENYYACMDGGSDYMPELAHGRISVRDSAQAQLVVSKIINYEKNPPVDPSFYRKGLHAGYFQDSTHSGTSSKRYAKTTIDMYDYMTSLGFESDLILYTEPDVIPARFNPYYTSETTIPSQYLKKNGYLWDGDKYDILNALNDGRLYAFHRDHGLRNQWVQPNFTINDIEGLSNNDELPIVFSINCGTGLFTKAEPEVCFSEKLQRYPNGGAVGIVSATAETRSGYNDGLIIGMMDAIWSDPGFIPDMGMGSESTTPSSHESIYTMGDVMIQGLIRMTETWDPTGWADRDHFDLYHYFGDPAMRIWTKVPIQVTATHTTYLASGAGTLEISGSNCSDGLATICIGNELAGMVKLTNGAGTITLTDSVTSATKSIVLTISGHNYQPYISSIDVTSGTSVKIMPLGNSLTFDQRISDTRADSQKPGYRKALYDLLKECGIDFNYVGSESSGSATLSDPENAGFPGMTSVQMLHLLRTGYNQVAGVKETDGHYLDYYKPEVILLHIGTNSLTTDVNVVDSILDEIDAYKLRSGIKVKTILAKIVNQIPVNNVVTTFNTNLAQLVTSRADTSLFLVDMETASGIVYALAPEGNLYDAVHPDIKGYIKMSQVWIDGIGKALKFLPDLPKILNASDATVSVGDTIYQDIHVLSSSAATLSLSGLQTGMEYDPNLGILKWVAGQEGEFTLTLTASNNLGSTTKKIVLKASTVVLTPVKPQNLNLTLVGTNAVKVDWVDASDNETSFELERSTDGSGFVTVATLAANSVTTTNIVPISGINYYYRIKAVNQYGASDYTQAGPIYVPTELTLQVAGYDEVFGTTVYSNNRRAQLITMPENGTIYKISMYHGPSHGKLLYGLYTDNGGKPGTLLSATAATTVTASTDWQEVELQTPVYAEKNTSLWLAWVFENAPAIYYESGGSIRAYSSAGYSDGMPSDFRSSSLANYRYSIQALYQGMVTNPVPATPLDLTSDYSVSVPSIYLCWTDTASTEDGFIIERQVNSGGFSTLRLLDANQVSFTDLNVSYNNTYVYRVYAFNSTGHSAFSNTITVVTEKTPSPPSSPSTFNYQYTSSIPAVLLSWTDNSGDEDNFIIQRSVNAGGYSQLSALASNITSYTDNAIEYNKTYIYRLFAENANGNSDTIYSSSIIAIQPNPPNIPANIHLALISHNSIQVTWDDQSGDESVFEIERSLDNGSFTLIATVTENLESLTDVIPQLGAYYAYRIRSVNGFGYSDYLTSGNIHVPVGLADETAGYNEVFSTPLYNGNRKAQMITMPKDGNINKISMYHGPSHGLFKYALYSDNNGHPGSLLAVTAATTINNSEGWQEASLITPVFVEKDTRLWIAWIFENAPRICYTAGGSVRANSSETYRGGMPEKFGASTLGNYKYSIYAVYQPVILNPLPTAPSNLTYTYQNNVPSVALNWTDNASDELGYIIERSTGSGAFAQLVTLQENAGSYTDETVSYNNTYRYAVYAYSENGNSSSSGMVEVVTIQPTAPVAPSNLSCIFDNLLLSVSLNWSDNSNNENSFVIERRITEAFAVIATLPANASSFTDNSILINQTYEYRLMATNEYGNSDYSALTTISTAYTPPAAPDAPANLTTIYAYSVPQIVLSWSDKSDNETGFCVEKSMNGSSYSSLAKTTANITNYTDAGISYGNTYQYRISAFNNVGSSDTITSNALLATIPPIAPASPSSLNAVFNDNARSIALSWTDNSVFENGFILERSAGTAGYETLVDLAVNVTSYEDLSISYEQNYRYRITAYNSFGNSVYAESSVIYTAEPNNDSVQVGYTDIFSIPVFTAYRRAQRITIPSDGAIKSISMYLNPINAGNYLFGVYSDKNGTPDILLATTAATPKNTTVSWNTANLLTPIQVTYGQNVWLAWVFDHGTEIFYTDGTPGRANSNEFWTGSLPSSFGSSTFTDYIYSIYMTLYPSGSKKAEENIPNPDNQESTLLLYPNPFRGNVLNFEISNLTEESDYTVVISDLTGRTLLKENISMEPGNNNELYFNQPFDGSILLFRLYNQTNQFTQKITVLD